MTTAADLLAGKKLRTATITVDTGGGSAELHLQALPRRKYRELLDEHPSEDPEKDWADTFPPALIAATITDPPFTLGEAQELWDEWEVSESARLFLVCHHLNERPELVGFITPGSAMTGGSGRNSTTAPH